MRAFAPGPLRHRHTQGPSPSLVRQCAQEPRLRSLQGDLVAPGAAPASAAIATVLRVLWRSRVPARRSSFQESHPRLLHTVQSFQPGCRLACFLLLTRAILLAAHPSRKSLPSPGELFDLFQERDLRRAKNPSCLHLRAHLFTLTILADLLQIPLEQYDHFIWVIGTTEELSPFGTSDLSVGTVCIKDRLPPGVVRNFLFDYDVWHRPSTSLLVCRCGPAQPMEAIDRTTAITEVSY